MLGILCIPVPCGWYVCWPLTYMVYIASSLSLHGWNSASIENFWVLLPVNVMNTVVSLLDLYSQCLSKIIPVVCHSDSTIVGLFCRVLSHRWRGIWSSLCSHHCQCHEQLWGAPSTDTAGHRSGMHPECRHWNPETYMFICHTLCVNCNVHMYVSMLFYMYPLTSL